MNLFLAVRFFFFIDVTKFCQVGLICKNYEEVVFQGISWTTKKWYFREFSAPNSKLFKHVTKSHLDQIKSKYYYSSILDSVFFLVYINICNDLSTNKKLFVDDTSLFSTVKATDQDYRDLSQDLEITANVTQVKNVFQSISVKTNPRSQTFKDASVYLESILKINRWLHGELRFLFNKSIKRVLGTPRDVMVKRKLPLHSGFVALRQVTSIHKKES